MASFWQILFMAVLQGVTEFLPVSSSGHLVIAGELFGYNPEKVFSLGIFMHAGSFFAIVIFYFKLLLGFLKKDQLHLMLMIVLSSVPAGIAGVLLMKSNWAERLFSDPVVTGMAFLVTGAVLRLTSKEKLVPDQEKTVGVKEISWKQALIVGVVQMFALLPGISRSGSTISAGLFCGIKREDAAAFSFLLALPAVGGATLLELLSMSGESGAFNCPVWQIICSVVFSFLVSLGALTCVVKIVKKSKLSAFSWYLFALGAAVLVWQIAF